MPSYPSGQLFGAKDYLCTAELAYVDAGSRCRAGPQRADQVSSGEIRLPLQSSGRTFSRSRIRFQGWTRCTGSVKPPPNPLLLYKTEKTGNSFLLRWFFRAIIANTEANSNQITHNNAKCVVCRPTPVSCGGGNLKILPSCWKCNIYLASHESYRGTHPNPLYRLNLPVI